MLQPIWVFPVAFETVPLLLLMMMAPRPCFHGGLWRASSFCPPLLRAVSGLMSLTSCPQVVTQAPSDLLRWKQATCDGRCGHFICIHRSFWGGCWTSSHASLGLPFHFCSRLFESLQMMSTCKGFECNLAGFFNQREVFVRDRNNVMHSLQLRHAFLSY